MISLIEKFSQSLAHDGAAKTVGKAARYLLSASQRKRWLKERQQFEHDVLRLVSAEERFNSIYEKKLWGAGDDAGRSVSGPGSSLIYTANLRKELPPLIRRLDIRSIFDAPCGDFNWMKLVLAELDVTYVGADIVKPLIESLTHKHADDRTSFIHLDLIEDRFPRADLMLCRDCLFHLSYADAHAVLENFVRANIRFLLTTTHVNQPHRFDNVDIATGDFRYIDLYSKPYRFSRNPLCTIDDWMSPEPPRQLALWNRDQVIEALSRFTAPTDTEGWD